MWVVSFYFCSTTLDTVEQICWGWFFWFTCKVNENISDYRCTLFPVSCSSQLMRRVRKTRDFPWLEAWALCLMILFSSEWPCCAPSHVSPPFFHMIEWSSHLKSDALMAIIYVAFTSPSHPPVRHVNCSFKTLENKHFDNKSLIFSCLWCPVVNKLGLQGPF